MPNPISFKCPLCASRLNLAERSLRCDNNHCFDIAKEGYVNLVPVQNKKSKQPGDSDAMINSRRAFLASGHYQRLREYIQTITPNSSSASILDMGCGEGYYLDAFDSASDNPGIAGYDLSKSAVKLAAKKNKHAQWSVANSYSLPYFDNSFDILWSIFSPYSLDEILRILKPGGRLIIAGPGPQHLNELAALVYDTPQPHEGNFKALDSAMTLDEIDSQELNYTLDLRDGDILDLLKMTPYYWSASKEKQAFMSELSTLKCTADFVIKEFEKRM